MVLKFPIPHLNNIARKAHQEDIFHQYRIGLRQNYTLEKILHIKKKFFFRF